MKKLSLFLTMTLVSAFAFAQVIFQVQTPAPLAGNYTLTWADPGGNDWATPDLLNPANAVTGILKFVDVPGGDTIACAPPLTANLTGNIAVVYRASCEFGAKALAAQNAGAIAVIIINNIAGPPVGMGGGASGLSVTIPVIMISNVDGALLRNDIIAGNITGFIGSKVGLFADDLGAFKGDVIRARRFSNLAPLSANASEFSVQTGTWVRNFGNQTQNGASASVNIDFGGNSVYSNSVAVNGLLPGDSIFVPLGTFSQANYPVGLYEMTYTIATANTDGDPNDNIINANFMISANDYSYGRIDDQTNELLSPAGFRPGTFTEYELCLAFDDPNASRMKAQGLTFSAVTNAPDVLTNEFLEIRAYQWDDVFTDINDPNFNFANLNSLDNVFFIYTSDDQDINTFVPFTNSISLLDNKRYLFCAATQSTTLFMGFDNQTDYTTTQATILQPTAPINVDGTIFTNGFGLDLVPAISVTFDILSSVNENDNTTNIVPFPNPAKDVIGIPVGNFSGTAQLDIFDIAGKLVLSQNLRFGKNDVVSVNVANIDAGTYVFKMKFEDNTSKAFNVLISK
ncbi:MAG: T9SS type A sorting domain-containing protein [Vicingaceae bacterium]|nr:T9SS type A sorting domain-containing protein [Vicingaceae bacterium]